MFGLKLPILNIRHLRLEVLEVENEHVLKTEHLLICHFSARDLQTATKPAYSLVAIERGQVRVDRASSGQIEHIVGSSITKSGFGTDGGGRTHTSVKTLDFESSA